MEGSEAKTVALVVPSGPISAELWQRLKRFDRGYEISMNRTSPMYKTVWAEAGYRRVWVVTLMPRDRVRWAQHIQCIHPTLSEALKGAVEVAERVKE